MLHTPRPVSALVAVVVIAASTVACTENVYVKKDGSSPGEDSSASGGDGKSSATGSPQASGMQKVCVKTACQELNDRRSANCSSCQDRCAALVTSGCDMSSVCGAICQREPCEKEEWGERCVKQSWKMVLPPPAFAPELIAACEARDAHLVECFGDGVRGNYDFGRCAFEPSVYLPTAVALLDCQAKAPCRGKGTGCPTETSRFGSDLEAVLEQRGCPRPAVTLSPEGLDAQAPYLRPEILRAATECSQQAACDDVTACMTAWAEAVFTRGGSIPGLVH